MAYFVMYISIFLSTFFTLGKLDTCVCQATCRKLINFFKTRGIWVPMKNNLEHLFGSPIWSNSAAADAIAPSRQVQRYWLYVGCLLIPASLNHTDIFHIDNSNMFVLRISKADGSVNDVTASTWSDWWFLRTCFEGKQSTSSCARLVSYDKINQMHWPIYIRILGHVLEIICGSKTMKCA